MNADRPQRSTDDGFVLGLQDWVSRSSDERRDFRAMAHRGGPLNTSGRTPVALAFVRGALPNGAIVLAVRGSTASQRPLIVTTEGLFDDRTFYAGIAALSWDESRAPDAAGPRVVRVMPSGEMISEADGTVVKGEVSFAGSDDPRRVVGLLTRSAANISEVELQGFGRVRLLEF